MYPGLIRWINYNSAAKAQKMWDNKKFARVPDGVKTRGRRWG